MKPVFSALAITLALTTTATADEVCMDATEMKAALFEWYGETPVDRAAAGDAQLWASEETGTWTIIRPQGDDRACVMAQGDDWMGGDKASDLVASLD
ncbi:S-adenosyl-L-homocysteine hydrolase [Sulfitobacter sabulilitoris]|nr:S-adenosyl-L-homocysteine hydrolase [Sulfitobacter sabulilitoris]